MIFPTFLVTTLIYFVFNNCVTIVDHAHDRNTSVNVMLQSGTRNYPINAPLQKTTYSIENCKRDPLLLRRSLDNMFFMHFQHNHSECDMSSSCKEPHYIPSFIILKDPIAVTLLTKFIKATTLYRHAVDYVNCRDTFYVESFNNTCLIYLDKRIHYKDFMYEIRQTLAVLDWNDHVGRQETSTWFQENAAQYKKQYWKSFRFVERIWELLSKPIDNMEELRLDSNSQLQMEIEDFLTNSESEDADV